MNIIKTPFKDLFIVGYDVPSDERGYFFKPFHFDTFKEAGLETDFKEHFLSFSVKDVIRGMHFQLFPYDHAKLVSVVKGAILDVAVDIRFGSPTFGQCFHLELLEGVGYSLYMGSGFAHGFLALKESIVSYMVTSVHNKENDTGIHWNSFGFDWEVKSPIVSKRDQSFMSLVEYELTYNVPIKAGDKVMTAHNYFNGNLDERKAYIVDEVFNDGKYFTIKGVDKDHFDTCFFKKVK